MPRPLKRARSSRRCALGDAKSARRLGRWAVFNTVSVMRAASDFASRFSERLSHLLGDDKLLEVLEHDIASAGRRRSGGAASISAR